MPAMRLHPARSALFRPACLALFSATIVTACAPDTTVPAEGTAGGGAAMNTGGNGEAWIAPTFAELRIGEYVAERSPRAQRIWIDDIAVGTTGRIACPAP